MKTCAKCSSKEVIDEAQVVDNTHYGEQALSARTYRNPEGFIWQGKVSGTLLSRICGSCGYVEFYLENPAAFLAAAKEARERKRQKK